MTKASSDTVEGSHPTSAGGRTRTSPEFRDGLVAAIPSLRAFAYSLSGRADRADDLVQETLTKAWAHRDSFQPGTNLKAWLYTILRNEFYGQLRKRGREVEDVDGAFSSRVGVLPDQLSRLDMADMQQALQKLPPDQREAVLLIGATGLSYEEAATICKVAVGTIKSRVNRGRSKLAEILKITDPSDLAGDFSSNAAVSHPVSGQV